MKRTNQALLIASLALLTSVSLAQKPTETQMRDNADTQAREQNGERVTKRQMQYFRSLDLGGKGYLNNDDVSADPFISQNFLKCDVDHDGKLTWSEFKECTHANPPADQR
jgi:hypothetical protein